MKCDEARCSHARVHLECIASQSSSIRLVQQIKRVDLLRYPPIANALCSYIEHTTSVAYAPICPTAILFPATAPPAVAAAAGSGAEETTKDAVGGVKLEPPMTPLLALSEALPILRKLGLYLNTQPLLIARLCRLCIAALKVELILSTRSTRSA